MSDSDNLSDDDFSECQRRHKESPSKNGNKPVQKVTVIRTSSRTYEKDKTISRIVNLDGFDGRGENLRLTCFSNRQQFDKLASVTKGQVVIFTDTWYPIRGKHIVQDKTKIETAEGPLTLPNFNQDAFSDVINGTGYKVVFGTVVRYTPPGKSPEVYYACFICRLEAPATDTCCRACQGPVRFQVRGSLTLTNGEEEVSTNASFEVMMKLLGLSRKELNQILAVENSLSRVSEEKLRVDVHWLFHIFVDVINGRKMNLLEAVKPFITLEKPSKRRHK